MMNIEAVIKQDHRKKANLVRKLKKKVKRSISYGKLEQMLRCEKKRNIRYEDYYDAEVFHDELQKHYARIELLEELLCDQKNSEIARHKKHLFIRCFSFWFCK